MMPPKFAEPAKRADNVVTVRRTLRSALTFRRHEMTDVIVILEMAR